MDLLANCSILILYVLGNLGRIPGPGRSIGGIPFLCVSNPFDNKLHVKN